MRTTVTLDDDVAAKLTQEARKTGLPFKQVLNETIRTGFVAKAKFAEQPPFQIKEEHLFRLKPGFNYDKVEELFDQLDGIDRLR